MKVELCKLADIPATGTILVPFFGRDLHVWLAEGRPRAAANACLHFGGPLECRDGRLVCPWHGAAYDLTTGSRVEGSGRADARLMFLSTAVEGDALVYVWGE